MSGPAHPFPAAFMARDLDRLTAQMSPDVLFRSPIISTPFRGREQVTRLFEAVFETFEDVEFIEEIDDGDRLVATFWIRLGRQQLKSIEFVRVDGDGLVSEIELFVRPMAGTAALASALAPRLGRWRGRARGSLLGAASRPLAVITRRVDPIVSKAILGRREELR